MSFPTRIVVRLFEEGTPVEIMSVKTTIHNALVLAVEFDGQEVARRRIEDVTKALHADLLDADVIVDAITTVVALFGYMPVETEQNEPALEYVQVFDRQPT